MSERITELWEELNEFIWYIENKQPHVNAIMIIGSFMWKLQPNDLDLVLVTNHKDLNIDLSHFPNIEISPQETLRKFIPKPVWIRHYYRAKEPPILSREELITQLILSRDELKALKEGLNGN